MKATQGELFGFHDMRPRTKVPISAARIREAQDQLKQGDQKGALEILVAVREGLERYDERLSNAKQAGIKKAVDHADQVSEGWSELAYSFLQRYLQGVPSGAYFQFTTEQLRESAKFSVPEPPKDQAWGAVILRAAKKGLIRKAGYDTAKNLKSHSRPVTLWTKL